MVKKSEKAKNTILVACTPDQCVGAVISARRKELGLSGKQLGQQIGLSQQQISRYERGLSSITLSQLLLLSAALGLSLRQFMDEFFLLTDTGASDFSDENGMLPYIGCISEIFKDNISAEVCESALLYQDFVSDFGPAPSAANKKVKRLG